MPEITVAAFITRQRMVPVELARVKVDETLRKSLLRGRAMLGLLVAALLHHFNLIVKPLLVGGHVAIALLLEALRASQVRPVQMSLVLHVLVEVVGAPLAKLLKLVISFIPQVVVSVEYLAQPLLSGVDGLLELLQILLEV